MSNIGPDCIVSYIDMIGTSQLLNKRDGKGVTIIRNMHKAIMDSRYLMKHQEEICFWNDSVLLMAYVTKKKESYINIMREVNTIKRIIDNINEPRGSFAICVKGQAFPPPYNWRTDDARPRMNYLQASSIAFANCFEINKELHTKNIHWYIDSRIIRKININKANEQWGVVLYPRNAIRKIHLFESELLPIE